MAPPLRGIALRHFAAQFDDPFPRLYDFRVRAEIPAEMSLNPKLSIHAQSGCVLPSCVARVSSHSVDVPERLVRPHRFVATTREAASGLKAGDDGRLRIGGREGIVYLVVSR